MTDERIGEYVDEVARKLAVLDDEIDWPQSRSREVLRGVFRHVVDEAVAACADEHNQVMASVVPMMIADARAEEREACARDIERLAATFPGGEARQGAWESAAALLRARTPEPNHEPDAEKEKGR